jgi:hypothetical protein
LVAPVATIGLDEVGREDLAGSEIDDRDLTLVDDGLQAIRELAVRHRPDHVRIVTHRCR